MIEEFMLADHALADTKSRLESQLQKFWLQIRTVTEKTKSFYPADFTFSIPSHEKRYKHISCTFNYRNAGTTNYPYMYGHPFSVQKEPKWYACRPEKETYSYISLIEEFPNFHFQLLVEGYYQHIEVILNDIKQRQQRLQCQIIQHSVQEEIDKRLQDVLKELSCFSSA